MRPTLTQSMLLALFGLSCVLLPAWSASAQMNALRNKDDQFIQALRDQGMSDLLDRFVEVAPPEEPIARRSLEIAQQQFRAEDTYARAISSLSNGDVQAGEELFQVSRSAYEGVLKSQRALIEENPDDERVPVWQTDLADMLLRVYLPQYHQKAPWYYEYGIPSAEQKKAFEDSVVLALEMTEDATRRLDGLASRVGADPSIRAKLEELGIWFKLQGQFGKVITPLYYGQSLHYVSLLPDSHPYYKALGANPKIKNQASTPADERQRLRQLAQFALRGEVLEREDTQQIAQLFIGSSMVWSGGRNNADRAVAEHLDEVTRVSDGWEGYLATLSTAVAKKEAGDLQTGVEILQGLLDSEQTIPYVRNDTSYHSRLIAADLMHRLLMEPTDKAQGKARTDLIATAYTTPYLPLIEVGPPYTQILYDRWASMVKPDQDPNALPTLVRMGVGEQLGLRAKTQAFEAIQISRADGVEAAKQSPQYQQMQELFEQANTYNQSLAAPETDDQVRARALWNLGNNHVTVYQIENELQAGQVSLDLLLVIPGPFATVVTELPDTEQAMGSAQQALTFLQFLDFQLNVKAGQIRKPELREQYVQVAEATFVNWPTIEIAHSNRSYIGAYVYEPRKLWDKAVEVYRGCPPEHASYFDCRTQMMWVLRRQYRELFDQVEIMENNPPADDAAEEVKQTYARQLADQKVEMDRVRRELLDDANHLRAVAERAIEDEVQPGRRFSALLALGAAKVVGSLMLGDAEETERALAMLEGFEQQFAPDGEFSELVAQQANVENAKSNLDGIVRSGLESRILALVRGGRVDQAVPEARRMMDAFPDAGSFVINGVLNKLETEIKKLEEIVRNSRVPAVRSEKQAEIKSLADVAVAMGEMVVGWAKDQKFEGARLMQYERDLARSLLIAGRPGEAAKIIKPWIEEFDRDPNLALLAGNIFFAEARSTPTKDEKNFIPAREQYTKVINAYGQMPNKPPVYWETWYQNLLIDDFLGGDRARSIPGKILKLQNSDPRLGETLFEQFEALRIKHLAQG